MQPNHWIARTFASLVLLGQFGALPFTHRPDPASSQIDLVGPGGSVNFGEKVDILPNGNLLIWDEHFNGDRGAVYLYNGATHVLISQLTGTNPGDLVGGDLSLPIDFSPVGNNAGLILSPQWSNQAGAVTWFDFTTGVNGQVSAANSLVGSQANDQVGSAGVNHLSNGDYVVASPNWANGGNAAAGAVTWGNGNTGVLGAVGSGNSLIGCQANDQVGSGGVAALNNGNYVVASPNWANGGNAAAGAVTWGDGTTGAVVGAVSQLNSLIGSQASDLVGSGNVVPLNNGNYVVASPNWANSAMLQAGAVTWVNGLSGLAGVVTTTNSLVGNLFGDQVGFDGINELANGN